MVVQDAAAAAASTPPLCHVTAGRHEQLSREGKQSRVRRARTGQFSLLKVHCAAWKRATQSRRSETALPLWRRQNRTDAETATTTSAEIKLLSHCPSEIVMNMQFSTAQTTPKQETRSGGENRVLYEQ
ncbi:uncharacterized protein V6R79_024614 [Siganus canaliculatus]